MSTAMRPANDAVDGQLERELAYYRRECNDLGARLLRAQEEQARAFREARRSRTVARLIREAYRLADHGGSAEAIGGPMLETVVDNAICDRAALLAEEAPGSGRFRVTHAIGLGGGDPPTVVTVPAPPPFFYTTSRSRIEPPAYELTGILRLPYILWAYDRGSGHALILGNQSESNVSRPFEDGDQELIEGALSVYIDVLLRKGAELELRSAKLAAEEASHTRQRFLATLTHELRTPLNAINGFSEMLLPPFTELPERQGGYAAQILASGRHLLALINTILDYSSLSRSAPTLASEWVELATLLGVTTAAIAATAAAGGVEVVLAPPPPALLHVDPTRFRQVLDNLVSNAVKFTPRGGRVDVAAAPAPDGGIEITVRDSGVGMRPEDIPRALEPFQQVENALTRTGAGTGLGLPIAKGLVEAHGGTLRIESAAGRGTTVHVLLPPERVGRPAPP